MNPLRNRVRRVDAHDLMLLLVYVSKHSGVTISEIGEHLSVSDSTVYRMIRSAREQFEVSITWRSDHTMPTAGEYYIENWGVFDSRAVRKWAQKNRARRRAVAR